MKDPAAERANNPFFYRLVIDHGGNSRYCRCAICECLPKSGGTQHTVILPDINYTFRLCSSAYCLSKRPV